MKQMQCNVLNIKTPAKQVWLYFHRYYHESSDCFEYPQKNPYLNPPLNQATQKNTCQIFLPKKSRNRKFQIQKKSFDHPVTLNPEYPPLTVVYDIC